MQAILYIPQRPPFVMVDTIVSCSKESTITHFLVREENLLVKNNLLEESAILENIAQSCAARIGFLNQNSQIPLGVIGSVKDFVVYGKPAVGDTLETTITFLAEVQNALVVDAETWCHSQCIARCQMKVFVVDNDKLTKA